MNEQNNNNSYLNNLQPTKLSWASLVSVFIIGLISVGVGALTAHLTFEQSQFGKNQRAIKVSLLLAAYWENIFDSETSRKLLRTMDSSERNKIMKYLATPINKINVSEVKKDKAILSLLIHSFLHKVNETGLKFHVRRKLEVMHEESFTLKY